MSETGSLTKADVDSWLEMMSKPHKQKCLSGHTQFYYTAQGISYRCRHCKSVQVVTWEEIMRNYRELVNSTNS